MFFITFTFLNFALPHFPHYFSPYSENTFEYSFDTNTTMHVFIKLFLIFYFNCQFFGLVSLILLSLHKLNFLHSRIRSFLGKN